MWDLSFGIVCLGRFVWDLWLAVLSLLPLGTFFGDLSLRALNEIPMFRITSYWGVIEKHCWVQLLGRSFIFQVWYGLDVGTSTMSHPSPNNSTHATHSVALSPHAEVHSTCTSRYDPSKQHTHVMKNGMDHSTAHKNPLRVFFGVSVHTDSPPFRDSSESVFGL